MFSITCLLSAVRHHCCHYQCQVNHDIIVLPRLNPQPTVDNGKHPLPFRRLRTALLAALLPKDRTGHRERAERRAAAQHTQPASWLSQQESRAGQRLHSLQQQLLHTQPCAFPQAAPDRLFHPTRHCSRVRMAEQAVVLPQHLSLSSEEIL